VVKYMQSKELKRSKLQILSEILHLRRSPQAKTRIMQKTNTSYRSLQNHLVELKKLRLIEFQSDSSKYAVTKKGLDFLEKWMKLQEILAPEDSVVFGRGSKLIAGRNMLA
jgi:predicted transcriptional regulator